MRLRWHTVLGLMPGLALVLAIAPTMLAQQNAPHVGYVYPAGGRQGTEFEVTVGGQFLNGLTGAFISGSGVEVTIVEHIRPLPQMQVTELREKQRLLAEKRQAAFGPVPGPGGLPPAAKKVPPAAAKKQPPTTPSQPPAAPATQGQPPAQGQALAAGQPPNTPPAARPTWTAEDEKTLAEIRRTLVAFQRRISNPVLSENVTLHIKFAPGAEPGHRELRLATPGGLTNPLAFEVGQVPEVSSKPAMIFAEQPVRTPALLNRALPAKPVEAPARIALPAVLNGQMMPGTVDRYRFQAAKGQHLVVAASARELMPYISDAVPGWFQATLSLYDSTGKEVEYADHFRFHPDPVLYYQIPSDGEYTLAIHDSIYRGRDDFVYRVTIGELPYVTSIFPLGGKAGAQTPIEVRGWNLPVTKVKQAGKREGVRPVFVQKGELVSNPVPFEVSSLKELLEKEPNNQEKKAQGVKLPIIVNGRIGEPGDEDVYSFKGRAGDQVVAEVTARRLDSPLDSVIKLTDAAGKLLAANDDSDDKGAGLLTHQADSLIQAKLPANGTYYVHIADTQHQGGPDFGYRLRISPPQPDFELRVVPASVNVRSGLAAPITVYAVRKDGFNGEIALSLKDSPPGFSLSGAWIPSGEDKVRLTLGAPAPGTDKPFTLHLEGRATIAGREVSHRAVPAEDMMQAFAYRHLVPEDDWMVLVMRGGAGRASAWKVQTDKAVRIPAGGTIPVNVSIPLGRNADQLRLALSEPPDGITIKDISPGPAGVSILLSADAAKIKPGVKGNLIVNAFLERPPANPAAAKRPNANRQPFGTLPAIPFEVVKQ